MYSPIDIEGVEYQLKPMNCPFHITIYRSHLRSYRELPLRYAELGTVYRFERSGVLHGLMRVRGFTQDDAHIFCRMDQLEDEILRVLDFVTEILKTFGFERYDIYLSTKPEKASGSDEQWEIATGALRAALEKRGLQVPGRPGRGHVLRAQDRPQDQGLARPLVAVLDRAGRLPQPEPLRDGVHRRGRQGAPAGDGAPRAAGQPGALLRRSSSSTTPAPSRCGSRRCRPSSIPVAERHHAYAREVEARADAGRACACTSTTAARSWATRSARRSCRRSPTCWSSGTRKPRPRPCRCATGTRATSAPRTSPPSRRASRVWPRKRAVHEEVPPQSAGGVS